ncbi:MAG: MMPL family transporter, partial [Bdellovibrionales bacterium]|nr:MMPL family transporter [Bdellovibrionales bacterium]
MIIETHKPEGAKDPEFLKKVNHFIQWIEAKPYVTKTSSIVEIIKDINKTLHEENPAFYDIPDTTDLIGQQLFLYTMNLPQGMDINNRITINNDAIRLTAMWTIHDSDTSLKYIKEWEHQAKILGLDMKATGKYVLYQSINDKVVSSFLTSITIALLFISFLLIAGLKSITLGLVSLIPNTTPLFIGAGIAKLMGQPLDIGTVIVGSVCLGIAVDDTIHFLAQFGEFTKKGDDSVRATSKVFTYTLPALITTTIVLVASFATFILADFIPNRNFGMFVAIILAIALLADIVFLPALMMALDEKHERFKQKKKEKIRT